MAESGIGFSPITPASHNIQYHAVKKYETNVETTNRNVDPLADGFPRVFFHICENVYPLVMSKQLLKIAIEIVSFPIKNGDFPEFFVCLPEGTPG